MAHITINQYLQQVLEAIDSRDGLFCAELVSFKHPHVANPRLQVQESITLTNQGPNSASIAADSMGALGLEHSWKKNRGCSPPTGMTSCWRPGISCCAGASADELFGMGCLGAAAISCLARRLRSAVCQLSTMAILFITSKVFLPLLLWFLSIN
uniref:Uncharacterized protein n=1 Tax=Chelydra serpentina TaxID=8475 RepID=A0A8C3XWW9_CHESE